MRNNSNRGLATWRLKGKSSRAVSLLIGALMAGVFCQSASANKLDGATVTKLLEDKTWKINWASCFGGSDGCKTHWHWKKDGSICARGIGAADNDKCANDGKWHIQDGNLCWNLTWVGGLGIGKGYQSVCIEIEESASGLYETKRVGGVGIKLFEFSVLP